MNVTPYTPVIDATWIKGRSLYCVAPRGFQGKPVKNNPRVNSRAVQADAQRIAQPARFHAGVDRNLSSTARKGSPGRIVSPGKILQQNQTHTPKNRAQYALNKTHARPGAR